MTRADAADRAHRHRRRAGRAPSTCRPTSSTSCAAVCRRRSTTSATVAERSRDWWPLALHWSLAGEVPAARRRGRAPGVDRRGRRRRAHLRRRHGSRSPSPAVAAACAARRCRCSAASCSTSPALAGIVDVDAVSGVVEVLAGTFGPDLEAELQQRHGLSVGHFPQSFDIATVGGWVACRGAGQYSTRYGKIEDLVVGLEVVLADGTVVRTGGAPAAAVGPDLTQLFLGSEGTLGVITRVWLRAHPLPPAERRAAYSFAVVRRRHRGLPDGAAPRRDARPCCGSTTTSSRRAATAATARAACCSCSTRATRRSSTATMAVVADACAGGRAGAPTELVAGWLDHRNDTSALQALTRKGFVVDTMEIAAPWSRLAELFDDVRAALLGRPARPASPVPPVAQLPRRRLPLLHVRRHAAAGRGRVDVRRAVGRRPAGRARRRRQPVAPPRRRAQPGPLRRPRRSAPALGVLAAVKARARSRRASSTPASSACPRRSAPAAVAAGA